MNNIYKLMQWLTTEQAVDWLRSLTGSKIGYEELGALCNAGHCGVYVDCHNVDACGSSFDAKYSLTGKGQVMSDIKLEYLHQPFNSVLTTLDGIRVLCDGWLTEDLSEVPRGSHYLPGRYQPLFKPDEILALAAKINGDVTPQGEKPLHPSERRSVAQLIAALAALAELDISKPYPAAEVLRTVAAMNGLELPGSDETIVKYLKMASAKAAEN